jgi:nitroreductase
MDVFTAIKERRSCRNYSSEPVSEESIEKILDAAMWAPSPLNAQPWEFIVVTNQEVKDKIISEAERCREWAIETSGWEWLEKYKVGFLQSVPVMVVAVGDPRKTGVDQFQEEGTMAYLQACAAAIQNMSLAAHALGLGTLWFTFFDKNPVREILSIDAGKIPLAVVCLGKPAGDPMKVGRKDLEKKTTYVR